MKIFSPLLAIVLAATPAARAALPLHFDHAPLGNVVRVLSAHFHAPITLQAKARAKISGDFSHLNLRGALTAAACQAGLEVVPLGKDDAAGYLLRPPQAKKAAPTDKSIALAIAAGRRAALLQRREELMRESAEPPADTAQ